MNAKRAIYFILTILCLYFVYFLLTQNAKRVYAIKQQQNKEKISVFFNDQCLTDKNKMNQILKKYKDQEHYKELFLELDRNNIKYE